MKLQLSHIAHPVQSLGPGRRVAIWVAGCSIGCRGCVTPQLWSTHAGRSIEIERLAQRLSAIENLEGLTLTGGEPFEQAGALATLLSAMRRERPDWNVLAFTGFPIRSIKNRSDRNALLAAVDLLIAGPYKANKPSPHALLASSNQRIHAMGLVGERMAAQCQQPQVRAELGLVDRYKAWLIGILDPAERRAVQIANGLQVDHD
jgi:anaerobic ribonucleoside-triphosphate reductase activating protein